MSTQGDREEFVSASPAQRKREELLRRAKERLAAKKAGSGLARTGGPKPSRRKPIKRPDLAELWHSWPLAHQCEVCREKPAEEAHHVVKEQTLRKRAHDFGYDFEVVRWDRRNRVLICSGCHVSHTQATRRIHVSKLRADTFEFTAEFGFDWALEREYDHSPIEEAA